MSKIGDIGFSGLDPFGGTIRGLSGQDVVPHNAGDFMDPANMLGGHTASGSGGKKGGNQQAPVNPAAQALADISKQLFNESTPLRRDLLGRSMSFLNGGLDVTQSPQYQGLKAGSDLNFNRARNNTISTIPTGGALADALSNLETNRAVNMAQGAGSIAESELGRAMALGTGSNPASISGLGQAAGIQGQLQAQQLAQQSAQQAQMKQGAGAGAGALLAAFLA